MYFTLMLPYFVCSLVVVMFDGGVDEVFSEMGWKRDS